MNLRPLRRGSPIAVSSALLLLLAAAPAAAHVSVNPKVAEPGSYAKLTFRVPNERPDSATVQLQVALPKEQPLKSVSVKPVPGWKTTIERSASGTPPAGGGEAASIVSSITWSGGAIRPGEFQEFDVSVGPLPESGEQMVFKAIQTYDNGEVVRWIDVAEEGSAAKPEHPAPVLKLAASQQAASAGAAAPTVAATVEQPPAPATAATEDGAARLLGGLALAAGLAGVVLGFLARGAGRRKQS